MEAGLENGIEVRWRPNRSLAWPKADLGHLLMLDAYLELAERLGLDPERFQGDQLSIPRTFAARLAGVLRVYSPELTQSEMARLASVITPDLSHDLKFLKLHGWLPDQRAEQAESIKRLFLSGKTRLEIAEALGISMYAVHRLVASLPIMGITFKEVAEITSRCEDKLRQIAFREGVPVLHYGEGRVTAEGLAELVYLCGADEKICPVCGQSFVPKTRTSTLCSRTCHYKRCYNSRRRRNYEIGSESLLLNGWLRDLQEALRRTPPVREDRWVEHKEALQLSGLTPMRLYWAMKSGVLQTKLHPTKVWRVRKQPIRLCSASQLMVARKVYEQYAAKQK